MAQNTAHATERLVLLARRAFSACSMARIGRSPNAVESIGATMNARFRQVNAHAGARIDRPASLDQAVIR
jgi:hypothetical protein